MLFIKDKVLVIITCITTVLRSRSGVTASKSSSPWMSRSSPSKEDRQSEYPYNSPDPFVSESFISIAAVCADGIIMMALHNTQPEPLLYPRKISSSHPDPEYDPSDNNVLAGANRDEKDSTSFIQDLPESSRVALRIEAIDTYGSAIVTAGWRTDCNTLASKVRDLAATHLERYDTQGIHTTTEKGISLQAYGRHIAHSSAHWLATCAFSQKVRGLHCLGLLGVSSDDNNNNTDPGGHLWLIDSTGVYPVRAHAIGFRARHINHRLLTINFKSMKHEDAISSLLNILRDELRKVDSRNVVYLETAVIQSSSLKLKRKRCVNQDTRVIE